MTPRLSATGKTLFWTATRRNKRYVLWVKIPGRTPAETVVEGTTFTPAAHTGLTAHYRVRGRDRRRWSNEVSIRYASGVAQTERRARQAGEPAQGVPEQGAEQEALARAAQKTKEKAAREATEKDAREAKQRAEGTERAGREAKEKADRKVRESAAREASTKREAVENTEREAAREAKENAEREAKERTEREAKERAEREAKERAEREAKESPEREATEKAEHEAIEDVEREARERAAREAREKAEREAIENVEREPAEKAEREAKEKVEREATEKTEREAKEQAAGEAKEKTEREAKEKAESEAKEKAAGEAKEKAAGEAKEKAEREAKEKAEGEAKQKAEGEAKQKAEREAREKAELEAKERAEREAREKAEREAGGTGSTGSEGLGAGHPGYQGDAASWADSLITTGDASWLASHWTWFSRDYPPYGIADPMIAPGVKWTPYRDAWTHNSEGGEAGTNRIRLDTQTGRAAFMVGVNEDFARGAVGTFLDDWQYAGGHRPGGAEGAAWNAGETALVQEIRGAHPGAWITTNSHWFEVLPLIKGGRALSSMIANREGAADADYDRNLKAINSVFEEWGAGKTSGLRFGSAASYREWLEYVEWMHVVYGVGMTVGWDYHEGSNPEPLEWDLATLLLVSNGTDAIDGGHQYPASWPHRYEMNLGDALGPRTRTSAGLWSRQFSKGIVYTVENGGAEAHITLPEPMENSNREHITTLTLKANQGAVLTR